MRCRHPLSSSTRRAGVALAVTAAVLTAIAPPSAARVATGGAGRFVSTINWVEWGTNQARLPPLGLTRTEDISVGGQVITLSCTIGPITGGAAEAYRPGNWQGDALDEMYNIGGANGANQLVNGIANVSTGATLSFTFTCSAASGLTAVPLAGLVFADAEQSGGLEYVEGTAATGTWRIIDRYRSPGCTMSTQATRTGTTLRLGSSPGLCPTGPAAVAFLDAGTSATVTLRGGGKSAIALGAVFVAEHGDAPASYGDAGHLLQPTFTGGEVAAGPPVAVSDPAFTLAETSLADAVRLGAHVDPEDPAAFSADASGDDTLGSPAFPPADDEDAFTSAPTIATNWGASYTLPGIPCQGTGTVAGWIDWNHDGDFTDAADRSSTAPCASGSASLAWSTVPADAVDGSTFLRLRIAPEATEVAQPTGFAFSGGETEDHPATVDLPAPPIARPDTGTTPLDTPITVSPVGNDSPGTEPFPLVPTSVRLIDGDGTPVTSLTVDGEGAYLVDVGTGKVTFTPARGYTGTASSVTYQVADTNGRTARSTIVITVTPDPPPTTTTPPTPPTSPQPPPTPVDPPDNELPNTGAAVALTAGIGLALLLGGILVLRHHRRRVR